MMQKTYYYRRPDGKTSQIKYLFDRNFFYLNFYHICFSVHLCTFNRMWLTCPAKRAYSITGERTKNTSFKCSKSKTFVKELRAVIISITDWSGKKDIKERLEGKTLGLSNEELKKRSWKKKCQNKNTAIN
jgi:hypothetical protein